jgi:hypothetical protein
LVESSRVLQSSANCVADELIESMNISNTNWRNIHKSLIFQKKKKKKKKKKKLYN